MVDQPRPGFFLIRQVKGGPRVPARIWHDFGHWWAEIDGKVEGARTEDPFDPRCRVERIWNFGREIDQAEYDRRMRIPASERPDPYTAVDLANKRSIF